MSDSLFNPEQKKLLPGVKVVWVLGGPSSGKRTQCTRITQEYGCTVISPSMLIRKQIEMETELGKLMKNAKTTPTFEMLNEDVLWYEIVRSFKFVLNIKAKKLTDGHLVSMILVHGYPLNIEQAKNFEKEIKSPDLILLLNVEDDILRERTDKAEKRGKKQYDTDIEKRLWNYHEFVEKICQEGSNCKDKCVKIDASHSRDIVFNDIRKELEKLGAKNRLSILENKIMDSSELYGKTAFVAGLSAAGVVGIAASGMIAAGLQIYSKEAHHLFKPLAVVAGIAGVSMIGASLYYLYADKESK